MIEMGMRQCGFFMWNKTTPDLPPNQDELTRKPTYTIFSLIEMGEGRSEIFIHINQVVVNKLNLFVNKVA